MNNYALRMGTLVNQFNILANIKGGERPSQNFETKEINGVYTKPVIYGAFFLQACTRKAAGDSTSAALDQIKRIVKETKAILKEDPFKTSYESIMSFNQVFTKINCLKASIEGVLSSEKGLDAYKETVTSNVNLIKKDESVKVGHKDRIDTAKRKLELIFNDVLVPKVERFTQIQNAWNNNAISPNQKLEAQLSGLMNPESLVVLNTALKEEIELEAINIECFTTVSSNSLKAILINSFGESLVNDVFKLYFKETAPLTLRNLDIQALLVGIVANLTREDILFILEKKSGIAYNKIKNLNLNENIADDKNLAAILSTFRNIDLTGFCIENAAFAYQVAGDLQFLDACKFNNHYNFAETKYFNSRVADLKTFGSTEQISRNYVYALFNAGSDYRQFRNGILFPIYDEKGELKCKEGHHVFSNDSIYAFGILPTGHVAEEDRRVQIAFRGTADLESAIRDLNPLERPSLWKVVTNPLSQGPGTISFATNMDNILAGIENFLMKSSEKFGGDLFDLDLMGHSLGASDAQRALVHISQKITSDSKPSIFAKINNIALFGYNPPAIEASASVAFRDAHSKKQKVDQLFTIRYFISQYDAVSTTGEDLVGRGTDGVKLTRIDFYHPDADGSLYGDSGNSAQGEFTKSNPGLRKFNAHTYFNFSETKYGDISGGMNPVYVCGACTNNENDADLIGNQVFPPQNLLENEKIHNVLHSGASFVLKS